MDFQSTALQLIRSQIAATRSGNPHLARHEIRSILANSEPIKMLATDIARLNEAAADVHPSPTDAQKEALNFKQGHFSWKGIPITIETAKGTYRRGVSKDGKPWKCLMQRAHYGRIKRSEGADGENIDVFLCDGRGQGESLDSDVVFVVNQVDPSGKFDEHKFILGCASKSAAKAVYLAAYPSNWNGCGSIVALTVPQFKKWLEHGKTSRAIGEVDGIAMLASPPQQNGEPTAHADYPTMLIAYLDALVDAESGDEESNEVADELHGMMFGGNQENNEGPQVDPETIKTLSSLPDGVSLVMLDTQPQVNDGQQTQWQRLPRGTKSPISGKVIRSDQAWYDPKTQSLVYGKGGTGRQRTQQPSSSQPVQKQLETPEDQAAFQANKSVQADRAHEIGQAIAAHARGEIDTAPTVKDYRELINLMPHLDMKQRVSIRNTVLSAFGENAAQKEVLANALREHVKAKIAKMGLDNADDPIAHATGSVFGKDELKIKRQSGKRERYGSTKPPPPPPTSSPSGKPQSGPSADAVVHAAERVTSAKTPEEQKSAIADLKHIREAHVAAKQDMRANADLDAFMDEPVPQEQLDEIKQRNEREGRISPPVQKQEPIPQPPSTPPGQSAVSLDTQKLPSVKSPWEMTPEEFKKSGHKVFRTAAGSLYAVHPETGQTMRIKAGRDGVGHEGDTGLKTPSTKTVYVPNNSAGGLSSAGITGPDGKSPKSRVIIKDGKASLLTWNEKENRWGVAPSGKDIQVHDKPGIGLQPLELWHPKDDVYGHEAYSNMHAGNAITSIEDPNEEHHKAFVDAARVAGKQIPDPTSSQQNGPLSQSPDATSLRDLQEHQNRFTPVEGKGGDVSVDQIEGGLADNMQPSSFDKASVEKGASVEKEHTSDPDKAAEIARDHLSEDPKYYEKLAAMEKGSIRPRAETAKSNYERTNPGKSFDAEFSGAGPERKQQLLDTHAPNHHLDVQDALEAGKEVPPEVLAEYPKLAKKYGKEVAKLNVSQSEGVFDPKLKPEQPANIDNPESLSPEVQKKREPVEREKKAKAKKESAAKLIKAEARERVKRHNEQADRHNKMLREAVEMLNIGKRGKDFIRAGGKEHEDAASMEQYGIDQVARSLASEYPDLLGGPGYRTDTISGEEPDYAGKLYELLSAGKKHRLTNAEAEMSLFEEHANIAGEHGQDNAWKFLREQAQKTRDRHADSHITSEGELHKEINNARVHAPESEISEAVRGSEEEANREEPIDPAREDFEDVRRDAESGGGQDSGDAGGIDFDPSEFDSISFDPSEFDQQQEDVAPSSQQTPEPVQPKQEQPAPEPKKEDHPFDEAISRAAKKKADDAAKAREEKKKANDPRGKLAAAVSAGNQDEAIDHLSKLTLQEQREELEKIGVPDGGKAKSKMQAAAMLRKYLGGGVVKEDNQKQEQKTGDELKQAVLDHIRDNPNVSTGDLRHAMNHKDFDKEDPLANPVHKALRELRDEGKVDVESPRFGDARAKIKEQQKQSDKPLPHIPRVTNEEFANGDWDQAHAGLGSEIVTAKMAEGMKGIDGREYGIREHSPGKWQLVSKIDKNAKSEADKKQELDSQQQLAPHHKEIFDSLSKTMDRQLADTSSVNRKLIIATGLMQGEPPAVQAALAKHLKENHRDAFDSGVANKQRVPLAMREYFKSPVPPGVDPSHAPIVEAIQKSGGPDELTVNNIEELRRKFYSGAKTPTAAKIREIAEAMKQSNFGVDSESGKQKPERRPMMLPFDEQDEQKQKDHHAAIPDLQKRLGWMDQQNYDKVNEHIGDAHDSMSVPEFRDYASKLTGIRFTNESRKKVMDTLKNMMEALSRTHLQVQGIGGRPADKPEHLKTDDEKVEPEKKEQPNLSEQLSSIPQGDRSRVNGFMVQRQGPDAYRIEKQSGKGYVSGTASEINDYIDRELKNQKAYGKQLPEALARAAAFTEPHWTDVKGTEQAEKGFNALPKGTPVVSLDEHAGTHGRTGQIVKDEQGRNRVKLDGEDGYATNHVEPLNKALSWRNKEGESGSSEPPSPKMSQGSLFAREADGTVKVAVPHSELADSPHHATVDKWLSHSDNSHLNPERRKMIGDSIKTTISRMHPKAADLALANMSSHPRLYNSTSDLTDSYNEILKSEGENPLEPGHEIGGYYQLDDEGHTGVAYLDYSQHEDEADAIWCHAHELHHAIDGFNTLSGTPEWDAAWRKEIRRSMDWDNHPLTRYASTKPWEGFAEFGAALVCDPDSSREMFPECYQFFKSKGLI